MTKSCVVPHCKTGYKSNKIKCSVFKVPKNPEKFKKWQAAIPGVELKPSQHVCEKHFEKKCILREWIKRDCEGKMIAQAPYAYPRLAEAAIPTIFSTSVIPNDSEPVDHPSNEEIVCADKSSKLLAQENTVLPMEIVEIKLPMETMCSQSIKNEASSPRVSRVRESIESLGSHDSAMNAIPPSETSTSRNENFRISNVMISDTELTTSSDIIASRQITVPKSWAIAEFVDEKGQSIVFSHFIKKKDNDIVVPVAEKCITVDKNKALRYTVYGRPVDPEKCQLPSGLENMTQLLSTMERFKNTNVCNGLGAVNIDYLSAELAFKDYVERWRDNNCSMVTKRKRCDRCMKMRQRVMKREARLKASKPFKRILHASNPFDQKKISALCKKNRCEKRAKIRAKLRVQLLRDSLKQKGDEIAATKAESLEEKFLKLKVPEIQQKALREIVSAASRRNSKNRHYSEKWIMMCFLLNVRSPGFYDFLRKNNVLPLPCKRTIRSYFSLIDKECGFDKQFGKLLAKGFVNKTKLQRQGVLLLNEIN